MHPTCVTIFTSQDFFNLIYASIFLNSTLFSFNYVFIVEGSERNWICGERLTRFCKFSIYFFFSRLASLQLSGKVSRVFFLQCYTADDNLLNDTTARFDFFFAPAIERGNCLLQQLNGFFGLCYNNIESLADTDKCCFAEQ